MTLFLHIKQRLAVSAALIAMLAVFNSVPSHAQQAKQSIVAKPIINLGIFPRRNAKLTHKLFAPLVDHLSKKLGIEVKLVVTKNFDEFWTSLDNKRFQLVHYNPYHYIRSHKELGYEVILKNEESGKDRTAGALIVHRDSDIKSLADVKGKKIVFGGGLQAMFSYIVPTYLLNKAGISSDDYQRSFAINPPNAVFASYYGQSDVSGSGTTILNMHKVQKRIDTSKLRYLAKSEEFAHLPWAVSKEMQPALRKKIQSVLSGLKNSSEGRLLLEKAQLTGLNVANDTEYDKHRRVVWEVAKENYCIRDCDYIKSGSSVSKKQRPLIVGIFPRRSEQATLRMFSRLGRYLSYSLDRPVEIKTAKTFDEFWKNLTHDKYDVVHYNQLHYVKSHKLYGYKIMAKNEERGSDTITPAILVSNTSKIEAIADLKGKSILFYGNRSAMVSYIANTQLLSNGGVNKNEYIEKFASNPWNACEATSLGEAAGCAVSTNCLLLDRLKDSKGIKKLKILTRGKPLPHLVWAANKRVDEQLKNKIQKILTSLSANANGRNVLSDAWLTDIHVANDKEYDVHRKIIEDVLGESY